jgi:hypothetical protein
MDSFNLEINWIFFTRGEVKLVKEKGKRFEIFSMAVLDDCRYYSPTVHTQVVYSTTHFETHS